MKLRFESIAFLVIIAIAGCSTLDTSITGNTKSKAETDVFIIENGKPNAEIVIAKNAKRMVALGALELMYYLEKITGARLPIVTKPDDRYPVKIFVGESDYAKKLGVTAEGLKYEAFRMVSGNNWLALVGEDWDFEPLKPFARYHTDMPRVIAEWDMLLTEYGGGKWKYLFPGRYKEWWNPRRRDHKNIKLQRDGYNEIMAKRYGADTKHVWNPRSLQDSRSYQGPGAGAGFWFSDRGGSMNAVCEFLRSLGVRWYMPHEVGEVVPELKSVSLPKIDKTVRPDFPVRAWNLYNFNGPFFPGNIWVKRLGMNTGHAMLGYAKNAHYAGHPRVYARMKESNPEYFAMIGGKRHDHHACYSSKGLEQETIRFAKFMYDHYDQPCVTIWPADGFRKCQCESCRDKTPSEVVWEFVDRVARELYKTHPDRMVLCGAYTPYLEAPSSIKKFSPNVLVYIANRGRPLFDNPVHWKRYWDSIKNWRSKTAPNRIVRGDNNRYSLKGSRGKGKPDFPIIHPRAMAKDLHAMKGISIGERGEVSQTKARWAAPGCDHLTLYVQSRFVWDADQDVEKIISEYYEKFYGPVAKEMKTALEFAQAKYSRTNKSTYRGTTNPQNVPIQTQVELLELLHKAREAAGDTIYGKRIDVILDELPDIEILRKKLAKSQKEGDPRADALQIEASKLEEKENAKTYKLDATLTKTWGKNVSKPDLDTTFSVMWTEKSLTFDIRCEEPKMDSIKIGDSVWEGDSVVLLIESPYHSYYQIEVGADGRIFDADRWGATVTNWKSMADVNVEKGEDFWRAVISIPIAILGEEGAEGDPLHYVVAPRIKPGGEWYFNLARRHPREGNKERIGPRRGNVKGTYVLSYKKEGSKQHKNMHNRDCFAKLVFK